MPQAPRRTVPHQRLCGLAALVTLNVVLSSAAQDALLLAHHPRSRIPIAMLVAALATAAATLGLQAVLRGKGPAALVRPVFVALGTTGLLAAVWCWWPGPSSSMVFFVLAEASTTVGGALTWAYFVAPLGPSEIRRLLPRLGMWAGLGGLVGGLAVPVLARVVSTAALPVASAGAWLVAAALVAPGHAAPPRRRHATSLGQIRSGLPLALVALTAGMAWLATALQYESRVVLQRTLGPAGIAGFMGLLLGGASIASLVLQATASARLLERRGVAVALGLLPAALLVTWLGYLATPFALLAPIGLFLDKSLRPSIQRPGEACVLGALDPSIRPGLSLALAGLVAPLARAASSLVLLALSALGIASGVPVLAAVAAAGLVGLALVWRDLYARTLTRTLAEGQVGQAEITDVPAIDGAGLGLLLGAVDHGSSRARAFALEMLYGIRDGAVRREMLARLEAEEESRRIAALRWVAHEPSAEFEAPLRALWERPTIAPLERAALIAAAGPLAPRLLGEEPQRWLDAPDEEVRLQAMAALLASDDGATRQAALDRTRSLIDADADSSQLAGLELLRQHPQVELLDLVIARAGQGSPTVRQAALATLAAHGDGPHLEPVWKALETPLVAHAAVRALVAVGEPVLPRALTELGSAASSPVRRAHLLRLVRHHGDTSVQDAVTACLADADATVRLEALKTLARFRRRDPALRLDRRLVEAAVTQELQAGLTVLRCHDFLRPTLAARSLLLRELNDRVSDAQDRLARALALLGPPDTMHVVFRAVRTHSSRQRDQARELLRAVFAESPLRAASLKLLDDPSEWPRGVRKMFNVPEDEGQALIALVATGDAWIHAALLHDPATSGRVPASALQEDPMKTELETILFLKDVALFSELTNPQLAEIARLAEPCALAAGRVLFQQGDQPDFLYLVTDGKLAVTHQGTQVARLSRGECVGEMAVLTGTDRTATVTAATDCSLLRFDADDFVTLLETYPGFGRSMLRVLVQRLARTTGPEVHTLLGMLSQG